MRLLLVEDDLAIQDFLQRALIEAGYQVDVAANARTGEAAALEGISGVQTALCPQRTGNHPHFPFVCKPETIRRSESLPVASLFISEETVFSAAARPCW